MPKQITFNVIPSGHIHGEFYANIDKGNGEITFTSENKKSEQSNLKTIRSMVKAIQAGNYRIVKRDLNDEILKEYSK